MATGDVHKKSVTIGPAVQEICSRTDSHTHRQTDKLIAILCSPTGVESSGNETSSSHGRMLV